MSNRVKNYNQLELKSIQLILDRIPNVEFFCTSASIPGLSSTAARQYSPFADVKVTGDKLVFQPLIVNFVVNEDMSNWQEIFDWMVSYGHPMNFQQYADPSVAQKQLYASKKSTATVLIPNNKYNITHEFQYIDVFPVDLSDVVVDTQIEDVPNTIATVTFEYSYYYKVQKAEFNLNTVE